MSDFSKHPCVSGPDRTPCNRIRLGEAFDINQDCHLCHKFAHNREYNRAWGGDGNVVPLPATATPSLAPTPRADLQRYPLSVRKEHPCRHLDDFTGEKRDCCYCGGGKGIALQACAVHGRCTAERVLGYREADGTLVRVAFCLSCAEYQPQEE